MEEIDIVSAPPGLGLLRYVKLPEIWEGVKRKCRKWFLRPRRIVIYGESGSGKSQFLHTHLGKQEDFDEQRTQTIEEYPFELSDGHKVIFIDTPGNQSLGFIRKTLQERYAKKRNLWYHQCCFEWISKYTDNELNSGFQCGFERGKTSVSEYEQGTGIEATRRMEIVCNCKKRGEMVRDNCKQG